MASPPRPEPLLIGAHVSIAGGFTRAVERGAAIGCGAIQVFVKGSVNWRARPLDGAECRAFRDATGAAGLTRVVAHGSYLVNLAEPEPVARRRALDGLLEELERASRLGIDSVIVHPGAHRGAGREAGIERVRAAVATLLERSRGERVVLALENTAGMGSCLGSSIAELQAMLAGLDPVRTGVCIDLCHAFAAGHDLTAAAGWRRFWTELERTIGFERLRAIHVNDSKRPLGSRVDRHEHLGRGALGVEPFARLMREPRFARIPKLIETPKVGDMDRRNLRLLRRLAAATPRPLDATRQSVDVREGRVSRRGQSGRTAGAL